MTDHPDWEPLSEKSAAAAKIAATPDTPAGDQSLHALLMQIRYDTTAIQGKLTEALRQVAALPGQGKIETAHDRAIAKALRQIAAGDWDGLTAMQLDVELDDLGIAHVDRPAIQNAWRWRGQHAGTGEAT